MELNGSRPALSLRGSVTTAAISCLLFIFFSACSNYQEEFDNNFGALEYADDEGESSPSGGDDPQSSPSGDNDSLSSSVPTSSGGIQSSSSTVPLVEGDSLNDFRDGKKYKLVTIGDQMWMAENLNFETEKSRCYDNSNGNCLKYGRLYTWADAQSVCPEGTHLPSYDEFNALYKYVREEQQSNGTTEAKFLKSKEGWKDYNGKKGGDDTYGFSALPAGLFADTGYVRIGEFARFLTSDTTDDGLARTFGMDYNNSVFGPSRYSITNAFSVRCLVGEAQPKSSASSSSSQVEQSSSSVKSSSSSQSSSSSVKSSSSVTSSSSSSFGSSGSFTYVINNKTYTSSYVRHNGLIWMNQDLENSVWGHSSGEWNGAPKYFTWSEAKKACPNGWRLPKSEEIRKSRNLENSTSFNDSGALAGYFLYTKWHKAGEEGMYWTGDSTGDYADVFSLKKNGGAGKIVSVNKGFEDKSVMLPVRCVQPSGNMFNEPRSSSLSIKLSKETFYDSTYVTVTIGDQTWMAENLLYYYNFGGTAKCYNGNNALCREYGNYFTWNSSVGDVNNACGKYQSNWVLPTESDINKLLETLDDAHKLASVGMGGTNEFEFDFVPSGHFVNPGSFKTAEDSEYASCFWLFTANAPDNVADAFCFTKNPNGSVSGSIVQLPIGEYHPIRLIQSLDCK